jgi:hypothetical protein
MTTNSLDILPGGDFCKVLRSTSGQQILIQLEPLKNGDPCLIGYTTFVVNGDPCLIGADIGVESSMCVSLIESTLTAEQELEFADKCLERLRHCTTLHYTSVQGGQ